MNYFTYLLERIKPVFDDYVPLESIDSFSSMYFETNLCLNKNSKNRFQNKKPCYLLIY